MSPAFWLGNAPLIAAVTLARDELPNDLRGALVVQPEPLVPSAAQALFADVSDRGGRLAVQLGDELPLPGERFFQFCRASSGDDELRRQLESLVAEPGAVLPREAHFTLRAYARVEAVAHAAAALLSAPARRVVGLIELILNAHEHGNLGIRCEKQKLLAEGRWLDELGRRERSEPWSSRQVTVEVRREADGQTVTICDEGSGFDVGTLQCSGRLHGRGVSLARGSFDTLDFEARGTRVVARVRT